MKKQITFITERLPREGSSGAESYNYYICQLLNNLGYEINIIVTGDYFYPPIFTDNSQVDEYPFLTVNYVHCKSISQLRISKSIKSYLRPIKKIISSIFFKDTNDRGALKIGRFISKNEAQSSKNLIPISTDILLFDTIFRYHSLFDSSGYPKVLVAHDVFSLRTKSFTSQGFKVAPFIDIKFESQTWQNFELLLAINEDERGVICKHTSNMCCTIFPQYKVGSYSKNNTQQKSKDILYIGANAHHNIHGLQHFLEKIWPKIIQSSPTTKLKVIGNIAESFRDTALTNVDFLGKVSDLSITAKQCAFAINPVYMGSGVKIKILDYLSLGLPCITTETGMMGFIRDDHMPIIETKDDNDFATHTIAWLKSEDKLNEARHSILNYTKHFGQKSSAKTLKSSLERAIKNVS